jgi:hypothetical protein
MDFDSFLDQAWNDHPTQAAEVAERLASPGLALVQDERQLGELAALAQHVHGQHLGRWAEGVAFQQQLAALPLLAPGSATAQALQRHATVLQLAGGLATLSPALPPAERTRLQALTAAALALHDSPRAGTLLQAAVDGAAALPDADPAVRALAAGSNNLASALQDEAQLSGAQQQLMVQAARVARASWERAGTWLEVERADYRLALCLARAGDTGPARAHAQACLARVQAQPEPGAPALEHFFGWECLARVEAAAGDAAAQARAQQQAEAWFARLAEADQAWCRASLDALRPPPR